MDTLQGGAAERPTSLEGKHPNHLIVLAPMKDLMIVDILTLELECWGHTSQWLKRLAKICEKENNSDTIGGVNKLISATPVGDTTAVPEKDLGSIKSLQSELVTGISNISKNANQDPTENYSTFEVSLIIVPCNRAIDDALERINVLLALRKAQEPASTTPPRDIRRRARSDSSSGIPIFFYLWVGP